MQKDKNNREDRNGYNDLNGSDEDQTTMVKTVQGKHAGAKTKGGGSSNLVVSPFLVIIYLLIIVAGLIFGRWLFMRTQTVPAQPLETGEVKNTPVSSVPSAEQAAMVTSTGFSCPPPQNDSKPESRELNMLVWTEYFPADWFECFEAIYNIKINRTEFSSNEEMLEILSTSAINFDIIQPSDQGVSSLIKQEKLKKLDKSKLSILKNLNPAFLNPPFDPDNQYSLPYQAGSVALAVNTDKVKDVPSSWKDLWNPAYNGRLMLMEDARIVIGVTLLAQGLPFNSTDPAELESIKPQLSALVKAAKTVNSDNQRSDILEGVIDLGLFWNGEASLAQRENSAVHYIYPSEGAILWQDNYVVGLNAQHEDATYAWINYTMQDDLFWMMLSEFPYTNPNQAALDFAKTNHPDLYNDYINSTETNVPTQVMLDGHWMEDIGDAQALYDALWTEVLPSQQ